MAKNSNPVGACGACTCGRCDAKQPKSAKKAAEPAKGSRRSSRKATQQLSTPGSMDAGASSTATKTAVQLIMRRAVEEAVVLLLVNDKVNRAAVARKHGVPDSQMGNFRGAIQAWRKCSRYCAYVRSTPHYKDKASVVAQPSAAPTLKPSKSASISKARKRKPQRKSGAGPCPAPTVRCGTGRAPSPAPGRSRTGPRSRPRGKKPPPRSAPRPSSLISGGSRRP